MTKEFLLNCDTKIAKSIVCTAAKHDDEHFDITKEVATDVVRTITESIMPISELNSAICSSGFEIFGEWYRGRDGSVG